MKITLYTKPDCVRCDEALETWRNYILHYDLGPEVINVVNVADQPGLETEYASKVPLIRIEDGKYGLLESPFDEAQIQTQLEMARRALHPGVNVAKKIKVEGSPLDRMARYIGQRWLRLFLIGLGIFVGLPWLAPIFAALGWWNLADPIYTAYAVT